MHWLKRETCEFKKLFYENSVVLLTRWACRSEGDDNRTAYMR